MAEGVPTLRVVTREEPPYVMKCLNCSSLSGNQSVAYQGFAIDLLDAISKVSIKSQWQVIDISLFLCGNIQVAGFHYSLYLVPDNLYGVFDHETKEWNGIVRQELTGILDKSLSDKRNKDQIEQ